MYKYVAIDLRGREFKPHREGNYSFSALFLQSIVYIDIQVNTMRTYSRSDGWTCRDVIFELEGFEFESGMVNELLRFRYDWLFIALVYIDVETHQEWDSVHVWVYKYVAIDLRGHQFKPQREEGALFLFGIVFAIHSRRTELSKIAWKSWCTQWPSV